MRFGLLCLVCLVLISTAGCGVIAGKGESAFRQSCTESQQFGATRLDFPLGDGKGFIIFPTKEKPDGSRPWMWIAPTFVDHPEPRKEVPRDDHAWICRQLLANGFYICGVDVGESYGSPAGRRLYSQFYEKVVREFALAEKACLLGQSRGGLMAYNWAAENPQCVRCIAGIYPMCNLQGYLDAERIYTPYGMNEDQFAVCFHEHNPIDRLWDLARADVPIFHVHGGVDKVVPLEENSGELVRRYKLLGGRAEVLVVEDKGHELCPEFMENQALVDFLLTEGRKMPWIAP
ncbi:MAG: prolyl oligopeptidase family serine peptidase [Sedimentisphaerales bacterium]|nr:prolyl oligopeptidase family serine peptidase [Sedimentisphaerales bacterium]